MLWYIRDHFQVSAYNIDDINSPAVVMTLLTSQIDICCIKEEPVLENALCGENCTLRIRQLPWLYFQWYLRCPVLTQNYTLCTNYIGDMFRYYTLNALLGYHYNLWHLQILENPKVWTPSKYVTNTYVTPPQEKYQNVTMARVYMNNFGSHYNIVYIYTEFVQDKNVGNTQQLHSLCFPGQYFWRQNNHIGNRNSSKVNMIYRTP